ncbi:MAG: Crp/Fnr family transcriptional regulator [Candidatus Limnocylindrales bacterium]
MSGDGKLDLLRRVPLFASFKAHDLELVARLADEIDVPAGKALTREGDVGHEFFVIVEGRVRVEREGQVLNTLGPGDFLGEIALVDGGPRTATAVTESNARLLVLAHREFSSLLSQYPSIQVEVLQALAHRVRHLDRESAT